MNQSSKTNGKLAGVSLNEFSDINIVNFVYLRKKLKLLAIQKTRQKSWKGMENHQMTYLRNCYIIEIYQYVKVFSISEIIIICNNNINN